MNLFTSSPREWFWCMNLDDNGLFKISCWCDFRSFWARKKPPNKYGDAPIQGWIIIIIFLLFCCYFFSRYKCILVFWVIVITDSTGLIWNTELCQHRLVEFDSNTWNQTSMAPCSSVLICLCVPVSLDTYLERSDMCVCLLSVWKKQRRCVFVFKVTVPFPIRDAAAIPASSLPGALISTRQA